MGYSHVRAITIDHTLVSNTDQVNYPLAFWGTLSYLATVANGGKVTNSSGFDIILASDNRGMNILDFERVIYKPTTGEVEIWVRIPLLSHTVDTVIYLLYGNPSVTTDPSNKTAVWDSHFEAVWHFGDGVTLDLTDSTGNGHTATNVGGCTAAGFGVTGAPIDGCVKMSGSAQYLDLGNPFNYVPGAGLSVELVLGTGASGGGSLLGNVPVTSSALFGQPPIVGPVNGYLVTFQSGVNDDFAVYKGAAETDCTLPPGTNSYALHGYDGVNVKFETGSFSGLGTHAVNNLPKANAIGLSTDNLRLGAFVTQGGFAYFNGAAAEMRISNIMRSSDYFLTQLHNFNRVAFTFYTIGPDINPRPPFVYVIT